jgi:hypothetical protein
MNSPDKIEPAAGYRFMAAADPEPDAVSGQSFSVEFYPAIEDFVKLSAQINKSYKLPSMAKYALQTLVAINLIGWPATLWLFGSFVPGLIVFAFNLLLTGIFLPATIRMDYRRYYRTLYPNIENEVVSVEINDEGIWNRHLENAAFYPWKNIRRIEEHNDSIYFFLRSTGFAVRKSGFAYEEQMRSFVQYAKAQLKETSENARPQIDKPAKKSFDY